MNYDKLVSCLDKPEDEQDERDYILEYMPEASVPDEFIIRELSPVGRQNWGTCTSWAGVNGVKEWQEGKGFSEYFNYVNSKKISGLYNIEGEYVKNMLKAICNYGVCEESYFPDIKGNSWIEYVKKEPSKEAYKNALKYKGKSYWKVGIVGKIDEFKQAISTYNTPVVFAMQWYKSYNGCKGLLPMPDTYVGGHAVCCVGYTKDKFIVKNSFGTGWGDGGYFYIPFSDFSKHTIYSCWVLLDINNKTMELIKEKDRPETYAVINGKHYYIKRKAFDDFLAEGLVKWEDVKETNEKISIDGVIAG